MGTSLARSFVVLAALSSFCATAGQPPTCKDERKGELLQELGGILRGTEQALKEIVQTQCQKLEKTAQSLEKTVQNLKDRLDVIETKLEKTVQSLEKTVQSLKDRLDVIETKEPVPGAVSRPGLSLSCERVGEDCVHLHYELMNWKDAQQYCRDLGGDLYVPTDKKGFAIDGYHPLHIKTYRPLFDFLYGKMVLYEWYYIEAWLGARTDSSSKATWASGERLMGNDYIYPSNCIEAYVDIGAYGTFSVECSRLTAYPLCH